MLMEHLLHNYITEYCASMGGGPAVTNLMLLTLVPVWQLQLPLQQRAGWSR